jgi:hypothetical protein
MKRDIICTDRGFHERYRLGFILEIGDRSPSSLNKDRIEHMRDEAGYRTGYQLTCGLCPRSTQITEANWRSLVESRDAEDPGALTPLDISRLPF